MTAGELKEFIQNIPDDREIDVRVVLNHADGSASVWYCELKVDEYKQLTIDL